MTDAERTYLRKIQNQLIKLAERRGYNDSIRISASYPGSPTIGQLRTTIHPAWKSAIEQTVIELGGKLPKKRNPRGRRTMTRRTNPRSKSRAGHKWGVYCKGTLAYVSASKPDTTKAKTKLKRAGFGICMIKKVGPNPVSGKVPVVGWREQFKKASRVTGRGRQNPIFTVGTATATGPGYGYGLPKAGGVLAARRAWIPPRTKKPPTPPKKDRPRIIRGRNPGKGPTYYWVAEGKMRTPGPEPIGYRKHGSMYRYTSRKEAEETANIINRQEGRSGDDRVRVVIGTGSSPRKRNPGVRPRRTVAGPSARAVAGRIGRSVGARVMNPTRIPYMGFVIVKKRGRSGDGRVRTSYDVYYQSKLVWQTDTLRQAKSWINPTGAKNPRGRGRDAGIGTRSVAKGGRLRNPSYEALSTVAYRAGFKVGKRGGKRQAPSQSQIETAIKREFGSYRNLIPSMRTELQRSYLANWRVGAADGLAEIGGSAYKYGSKVARPNSRRRNAASVLRRRTNPHTRVNNPRKGYVVQVGNSVAWVGRLATEAQKAMKKLLAAGHKAVKGFEAKLPAGFKRGWRKQFRRVSNPSRSSNPIKKYMVFNGRGRGEHSYHATLRAALSKAEAVAQKQGEASIHRWDGNRFVGYKQIERGYKANPSFGKGKLGTGSRFRKCVSTMKRRGVRSPGGLCTSIGRRKYGAKRMAGMARKGRRRSNPGVLDYREGYVVYATTGFNNIAWVGNTVASARKAVSRLKKRGYSSASAHKARLEKSIKNGWRAAYR